MLLKSIYILASLLVGIIAMGCADSGEASRTLVQREALDPKAAAFLEDVERAWERADFERVFVNLDSAARYAPDLADIPFWRGRAHVRLNRLDEAGESYRQVLELDPAYPGAWYELGNVAFRERNYEAALSHYQEEETVLESLLKSEDRLPEARPAALAATHLQMGRAHDRLGEVDEAYAAYQSALEADDAYAEAHYELSQLYETDGELESALEHARSAYLADSSNADSRYALGSILLQSGRADEALPHLQASVDARPWYHPALNNLGRALLEIGRREEAQQALEQAEKMQTLQVSVEQAQLDVQQYPDAPNRWIDLAHVLVQSGRYDEAEGAFNKAIYLEPMNLAFHNDAANLMMLRGQMDDAIRRFKMILEVDPAFVDGLMNLGVAYALSGEYDEAEATWKRVLDQHPDNVEARANLERLTEMR